MNKFFFLVTADIEYFEDKESKDLKYDVFTYIIHGPKNQITARGLYDLGLNTADKYTKEHPEAIVEDLTIRSISFLGEMSVQEFSDLPMEEGEE